MRLRFAALAVAAGVLLSACGSGPSAAEDPDAPLRIGVSPTPHGEILEYVDDNLAEQAGVDIEIEKFNDYIRPNQALQHGELDANYFQHQAYLDEYEKEHGGEFAWVQSVHLEPLALYSKKFNSAQEIPDGATVTISNDPSNRFRALKLLEQGGLIKLKPEAGVGARPAEAIAENAKNLQITDLSADQLPRSIEDAAAAVVNGNYAVKANLSDPLVVEKTEGNPYANGLVTTPQLAEDPRVRELAELLRSPRVQDYIEQKWGGEAVLPAA
ncbi:MetQ/NlpA family ABC transporter substrate-binding protein [Saccharopolyspora halophila]|uniref:Lipoprotein n=1 Tax=Saccharopolyspora halophila TaxID=405551 RepID=A0ABP5SHL8_9PSEU